MSKKHYGLIGHPLEHSMSDFVHKRLFELSSVDADYCMVDIKSKDLDNTMLDLQELDGYNVTVPHKQAIIQYMDKLSRKSKTYGAVNTVLNGELIEGYTTDADGFLQALNFEGVELNGRVVIVGSGGVARTIGYECVILGANTCIACPPNKLLSAAKLSGEIRDTFSNWDVDTCLIDRLDGPIDILVNATPVGMFPNVDDSPVPEKVLSQCKCVFDTIYNPFETKLQKIAKSQGAKVISGLYMLVCQAALSQNIWTGAEFTKDQLKQLYEDTKKEQAKLFPCKIGL